MYPKTLGPLFFLLSGKRRVDSRDRRRPPPPPPLLLLLLLLRFHLTSPRDAPPAHLRARAAGDAFTGFWRWHNDRQSGGRERRRNGVGEKHGHENWTGDLFVLMSASFMVNKVRGGSSWSWVSQSWGGRVSNPSCGLPA